MFTLYIIGPVNYGLVNPWTNYFQPIPRTRGYGDGQVYGLNAMQSYLNPYAGNHIPYNYYYPYNTNPNLFLNPNVSSPLSSGFSSFGSNQGVPFNQMIGLMDGGFNPFGSSNFGFNQGDPFSMMLGLMDGGFNPLGSSSFGYNQGPNPFDIMLGLMDGGFNPLGFSSFGFNQGDPFSMMLGLMDGGFNPQFAYLHPGFSATDYVAGQLLSRNHLERPPDEALRRVIAAA